MVMSRDQNAGRSHNIKFTIVPLKSQTSSNIWKHLTNKNSVPEDIRSRKKSGNASYHSFRIFCVQFCYLKT